MIARNGDLRAKIWVRTERKEGRWVNILPPAKEEKVEMENGGHFF